MKKGAGTKTPGKKTATQAAGSGARGAGRAAGARAGRLGREDLLREGLALLCEGGIDELTIDALCLRLGVTKGSFYHHFAGRRDYLRGLLEFWAADWDAALADQAGTDTAPGDRLRRMVRETAALPAGPETAIRAWAVRDAMARAFQERVDGLRLGRLEDLFAEVTGDGARARLLARIGYALFVGTRVMAPPVEAEERLAMLGILGSELDGFPA